ncbi:hypothetical protein [Aliamphritea spongicola]
MSWVQELLVVDGKRFSCSGALSGLEMMLHLIRTQHGNGLAVTVADELIVTHERHHSDPQRASLQKRLDSRNPRLADAVQLMENNIEEPSAWGRLPCIWGCLTGSWNGFSNITCSRPRHLLPYPTAQSGTLDATADQPQRDRCGRCLRFQLRGALQPLLSALFQYQTQSRTLGAD